MNTWWLAITVTVLLASAIWPQPCVWACFHVSLQTHFCLAEYALLVHVQHQDIALTDIGGDPYPLKRFSISVRKVFKGPRRMDLREFTKVYSEGPCAIDLEADTDYIVQGRISADGYLTTDLCSGTQPWSTVWDVDRWALENGWSRSCTDPKIIELFSDYFCVLRYLTYLVWTTIVD